MKLRDYIKEKKLTQHEFARLCGLSRTHITNMLSGTKRPGRYALHVIGMATNGKVTPADFD